MKFLWNKTKPARILAQKMRNEKRWENFIHSAKAVGSLAQIQVSDEERDFWPLASAFIEVLREIRPCATVVEFDASIPNGTIVQVVEMSNCG